MNLITSSEHFELTANSLRREVEEQLADAQMEFVPGELGTDLQIAGHLPIRWFSKKARSGVDAPLKFYEETTTLLLSYLIQRFHARMFLDIGAGDGYFSRVAASHAAIAPTAHAFEMRLDRVLKTNSIISNDSFGRGITTHLAAFSAAHKGVVDVWHVRDMLFEHRPEPIEYREAWWRRLKFLFKDDKNRELTSTKMLVTSIDHFSTEASAAPDIIKIDVEGYEGYVLDGAKNTLARWYPFVLLELHKNKKLRDGTCRRDVAAKLFALGYQALFLTDHQSRHTCEVVEVGPDSPLLRRDETDLILFFHPGYCGRNREVQSPT